MEAAPPVGAAPPPRFFNRKSSIRHSARGGPRFSGQAGAVQALQLNHLADRLAMAARGGRRRAATHHDQHGRDVVVGQAGDFGHLLRVEADHGAGVETARLGGVHQRHRGQACAADGLVPRELRVTAIHLAGHADHAPAHRFRGLGEDGRRVGVGVQPSAHHDGGAVSATF